MNRPLSRRSFLASSAAAAGAAGLAWAAARRAGAQEPAARPALAEAIAREKLAEAEVMLKAGKTDAAAEALSAWQEAVEAMRAAVTATPAARRVVVNALLEQQYIALTDYLDLPRDTRVPLLTATRAVSEACGALLAELPRGEREGLFFRAEEVRWSLEMAAAADAQGL